MIETHVFRALADPTRRAVFERLAEGEMTVSELKAGFDISQPAISQHLRILLDAGLVRVRQDGRQRLYGLNARPLREVYDWASMYRNLFTDPAGHAWRISKR